MSCADLILQHTTPTFTSSYNCPTEKGMGCVPQELCETNRRKDVPAPRSKKRNPRGVTLHERQQQHQKRDIICSPARKKSRHHLNSSPGPRTNKTSPIQKRERPHWWNYFNSTGKEVEEEEEEGKKGALLDNRINMSSDGERVPVDGRDMVVEVQSINGNTQCSQEWPCLGEESSTLMSNKGKENDNQKEQQQSSSPMKIGNMYRVEDRLYAGKMSLVYKATHQRTGDSRILKVIKTRQAGQTPSSSFLVPPPASHPTFGLANRPAKSPSPPPTPPSSQLEDGAFLPGAVAEWQVERKEICFEKIGERDLEADRMTREGAVLKLIRNRCDFIGKFFECVETTNDPYRQDQSPIYSSSSSSSSSSFRSAETTVASLSPPSLHWPILVLEYHQGITVADLIRSQNIFQLSCTDRHLEVVFGSLIKALRWLHHDCEEGPIVHRDIKPDNIMVKATWVKKPNQQQQQQQQRAPSLLSPPPSSPTQPHHNNYARDHMEQTMSGSKYFSQKDHHLRHGSLSNISRRTTAGTDAHDSFPDELPFLPGWSGFNKGLQSSQQQQQQSQQQQSQALSYSSPVTLAKEYDLVLSDVKLVDFGFAGVAGYPPSPMNLDKTNGPKEETVEQKDVSLSPPAPPSSIHALCCPLFPIFGTPLYLPPELLRCVVERQPISKPELLPKGDIWALGVCMYHMIERHTPFHGRNISELYQKTMGKLSPLTVSHLSPKWYEFMTLCLSMPPENRPSALVLQSQFFAKTRDTNLPQQ